MKSSFALLKYVIGGWTRPKSISVYIKKKNVRVIMETWGSKKVYYHTYIIHYHGPTNFVVGRAKEVLSLQMSRDHGKEVPF